MKNKWVLLVHRLNVGFYGKQTPNGFWLLAYREHNKYVPVGNPSGYSTAELAMDAACQYCSP